MTKNQNSKQSPYREDRLKPVLRAGDAEKQRLSTMGRNCAFGTKKVHHEGTKGHEEKS